jgi:hypothetical protein
MVLVSRKYSLLLHERASIPELFPTGLGRPVGLKSSSSGSNNGSHLGHHFSQPGEIPLPSTSCRMGLVHPVALPAEKPVS